MGLAHVARCKTLMFALLGELQPIGDKFHRLYLPPPL